MKNSKFYLNPIRIVLILSIFLLSCSSDDDLDLKERTQITMDIPADGDVDWSNTELVWNEEFNGSGNLDDIWIFEDTDTSNPDVADQWQDYRKENTKVSGGTLKIYATKEGEAYSSARLSSQYAFKYGQIEISAKLPVQEKKGIWAKFALIGDNINKVGWPQAGEIDIMEYFSFRPDETFIHIHTDYNNEQNGTLLGASNHLETVEEQFHSYGILWTNKYIKFYIDDIDNIIYTVNRPSVPTEENWPFDKHFYLLIDMVIGGRYAGAEGVDDSLFPAILEIDYIRVYHPE